ncbi:hypothetical protein JHK86_033865 [Glycine max]|nr:hypothetical protein JHK86_033865 [Glycine max]
MCMVKREAGTDSFNAEFPPTHAKKGRGSSRKRRNGGYRRGSTSLPDVTTIFGGFDGMIQSMKLHKIENSSVDASFMMMNQAIFYDAKSPKALSPDEVEAYVFLQECLEMRKRYVFREAVAPWDKEVISDPSTPKPNLDPFLYIPEGKSDHYFEMQDGVIRVYPDRDEKEELFPVADATTFFTDLHHLLRVIAAGNIRTLCHHRLNLLEQKFNLHLMLNADREFLAQKSAPHRDFYNVRKVDTHVHHSACMNQKHLLRFIKSKLRKEPDELYVLGINPVMSFFNIYDLNVDLLDVHADKSTFHGFDKFNLKYNPCGQSRLREIFLKQDNLIQGRFLGELTKQVFSDLAASKYQLPRLYNMYKEMGIVTSFLNMLDNIFIPLFEVTVNPDSHPQLHVFLKQLNPRFVLTV